MFRAVLHFSALVCINCNGSKILTEFEQRLHFLEGLRLRPQQPQLPICPIQLLELNYPATADSFAAEQLLEAWYNELVKGAESSETQVLIEQEQEQKRGIQ